GSSDLPRVHEMRQVARHYVEKAVGRVVTLLRSAALAQRLFNELAQSRRSASALAAQPFPMARQQRYFLCLDAKRRPSARPRCFRLNPEIQLYMPSDFVVESQ